ncbi:MAG: manganese efflux pump MntP family protein [Sphaerochaetaceae bacterium]|nr:manganese efflux pump MntP family protein [Sphaerochaetaceae bacterium]
MNISVLIAQSALLGVGLAMDAFCVSIANSLANPRMDMFHRNLIAITFGVFQFLMPLAGWYLVTSLLHVFNALQNYIPWISMSVLWFLGVKMIIDGRYKKKEESKKEVIVSFPMLLMQGVATSIDALSAGLTFTEYSLKEVLISCSIIAVVTYIICMIGLIIGSKAATKLSKYASALGGAILIFIGAWTFLG